MKISHTTLFTTTSMLVLVLSLLLASCGGSSSTSKSSNKNFDSSGSGDGNGNGNGNGKDKPPPTLSIESAPAGTSLNVTSYPVSGNCDANQGDVTVIVGIPGVLETAMLETAMLETAMLETAMLETAMLETAILETAMSETAMSETAMLETAMLETAMSETAISETAMLEMAMLETGVSKTVDCIGDPGAYRASLNISEIEADPMSVTATQGEHTASFSPSPVNDREGPASAPVAITPNASVNEVSYNLSIVCSEAGEVVSITGSGLNPDSQTHTCTGSGAEDFLLNIEGGEIFSSPNNLTLNSMDQYGNPAGGTTTVNIPIDTSAIAPTVSIDDDLLPDVDASNAQSFTFEGSCSQEGQPVMVSAGGLSPETDPDCTNNSWSVILDVTSLNGTSIPITADHSSSSGVDATQASESVTNSFTCPTNFVAVPSLQGYTTNSFCVMKYEAKNNGSGNAISQAASTPYVEINRKDSIAKCQAMGSTGYDLITNDEWQSVARNIELVGNNWKNGTVGDPGGLSRGHSTTSPSNTLEASSDDNNACVGKSQSCDSNTWSNQRRTHTLSNGEVIWDIAGNVWEWIKDTNTLNYGDNSFMSRITDETHSTSGSLSDGTTTTSRTAKGHFGPSGDYTNLDSTPYGGLGFGALIDDASGGVIVRGGGFGSVVLAGAFAVSQEASASKTHVTLGFRCTYHP